jgi:hypothetical protein
MPPPKGSKKKPQKNKIPVAVQKAIVKRLRKPDVRNIILKHGLNRNSENKITNRLESPLNLSQLSKTIIAEQELEHKIKLSNQRFKMVERSVKLSLMVAIPVMIALFVNKIKKDIGMYVTQKVNTVGTELHKIKRQGENLMESSEFRGGVKKVGIELKHFQLPAFIREKTPPPPLSNAPTGGWGLSWIFGKPATTKLPKKNNGSPSDTPKSPSQSVNNFG